MKLQYSFLKLKLWTKKYILKSVAFLIVVLFFAILPITVLPMLGILYWMKKDMRDRILESMTFLGWLGDEKKTPLIKVIEERNIEDLARHISARNGDWSNTRMSTGSRFLHIKGYLDKRINSWKTAEIKHHNPSDLI